MLEALVFAATTLLILLILPRLISVRLERAKPEKATATELSSRVIISHSLYMVFSGLALLALLFPTALLARHWIDQKMIVDVLLGILVPLSLFSLGYLYFIRFLRQRSQGK